MVEPVAPTRPAKKPNVKIVEPVLVERSQGSIDLARYYQRVQNGLLTRGLLRTDGGGADVPFSAHNLVTNFDAIALSQEMRLENGRLLAGKQFSDLHRWQEPVRISVQFGATVPLEQRKSDRAFVRRYVARLARVTGHSIQVVNTNPNFLLLVMSQDQHNRKDPLFTIALATNRKSSVDAILNLKRDDYCVVLTEDVAGSPTITNAVAVVRAEHPDLLRHTCYHEEIAQGLGLFGDSAQARPSIFNDDDEFGYLTTHDEMLLRMLYDPRMRPGLSAVKARELARVIAAELMNENS